MFGSLARLARPVFRAVRPVTGRTIRGASPATARPVRNAAGRRVAQTPLTRNPNAGFYIDPRTGTPRRGLGSAEFNPADYKYKSWYEMYKADPVAAANVRPGLADRLNKGTATARDMAFAQRPYGPTPMASLPRRVSYSANRLAGRIGENPLASGALMFGGGALADNILFGMLYGGGLSGAPQTMPQQYNPQDSAYTMVSHPGQLYNAQMPDEKQIQYEIDRLNRNQYYNQIYAQALAEQASAAGMTVEQAQALHAQMNAGYSGFSAAMGGGMYQ